MKIIVGLGNPGEKYKNTRHNLGFLSLDHFAEKHLGPKITWQISKRFKSQIIELGEVILVKPQTFMNNSGEAVSKIVNFYKVKEEDLIIVYDELDLPLGKIKVRFGGAGAGHHGIESIITALDSDKFVRIRLGIGNLRSQSSERGKQHFSAEHFVIESFMPGERSKVKHMIKQGLTALDLVVSKGLGFAQTQFN